MTEATATPAPPLDDVRPVVGRKPSNHGLWIFGAVAAIAAVGLFSALEARRAEISSPAISVPSGASPGMIAPPPELAIPADHGAYGHMPMAPVFTSQQPLPPIRLAAYPPSRPASAAPLPSVPPAFASTLPTPMLPVDSAPAFQTSPSPGRQGRDRDKGTSNQSGDERVYASRLANPATTVPQGTVMHAVLETALDSSRPGFARAIVSRDITGFDGTRVLIPKGSKLFGEYQSDVGRGQNRALIRWRRLTRPDGTIIDVDSPSADPLGRAGIKGKVNSHFFERFSGAILQSALDLGVRLAARQATDDTYIFFPQQSQAEGLNPVRQEDIRPTVTVKQGTSLSVFIARDLDFTDVEP